MTMSPGKPGPADVEGRTVPPYEGRQGGQEVEGEEKARRDGVNGGGS